MFSITTIEASTTRPIEIVIAPRVRMFSEYPNACRPMNVISTLVGIEIAVTIVERIDSHGLVGTHRVRVGVAADDLRVDAGGADDDQP